MNRNKAPLSFNETDRVRTWLDETDFDLTGATTSGDLAERNYYRQQIADRIKRLGRMVESMAADLADAHRSSVSDQIIAHSEGWVIPAIDESCTIEPRRVESLNTRASSEEVGSDISILEPSVSTLRPVRTALYRHFDADNALLYVGITEVLVARGKSHSAKSSWSNLAVRAEVEWFPSRSEAEAAEVAAIKTEHPLFNHVHNDTPEARQRLVAYLVEKDRLDLLAPAVSRG